MSSIEIDGDRLEGLPVTVLRQKDPFPGGHDYQLSIDAPRIRESLLRAGFASGGPLSIDASWGCLRLISAHIETARGDDEVRYLLNSVSYLEFSAHAVILRGVCSDAAAAGGQSRI